MRSQRQGGGAWNLLGTFGFDPAQAPRVERPGDHRGAADAIAWVSASAEPNRVVWPLGPAAADLYDVQARWWDYATNAVDAPFTIRHQMGEAQVAVDQTINGGSWQPLGSFPFQVSGDQSVTLSDGGDGGEIADAIRLVPAARTASRSAVWSFQVPTSEDCEVYAKWPRAPEQASNAAFTVHHGGGAATVVRSQRQGGGAWNLLGSFGFEAGVDYRVELSDQGDGPVVADAIYVVPAARVYDSYSWAPGLPAAGDYAVYAKWAADAGRASDAVYGVYHAGGLAEVALDQRAGAGQWRYLGTWAFDPAGSPLVVLAGGTDGTLSADALRFVGAGPPAAELRFVLGDHLGTPRKLTDTAGAVVWDRLQTPFGLDHAVTGAAATPVRFPGQYADAESGLSYNYYRDYDPSLGRYIQSDPIGLAGGLNTYGYVGGNPLGYVDPTGENARAMQFGLIAAAGAALIAAQYCMNNGIIPNLGSIGSSMDGESQGANPPNKKQPGKPIPDTAGTPSGGPSPGDNGDDPDQLNDGTSYPPIRITRKGRQHVVDRHTHSGIEKWKNKSKFDPGENIDDLILGADEAPVSVSPRNGNLIRTYEVQGRTIGYDAVAESRTSTVTVITKPNGNLVTAHPGPPST